MTAAQYATLEANRTDDAVELETVNHELTLWFMAHPGCRDEIDEYKQAQDELDIIAGLDDELAAHLYLILAKDWYRALTGQDWSERK